MNGHTGGAGANGPPGNQNGASGGQENNNEGVHSPLICGELSCNQHGPLHGGYDWDNEENKAKWQGLFSGHGKGTESPLEKVLEKVERNLLPDPRAVPNNSSGQLKAVPEALEYVESLLLKLLAMLTAKPLPASKADVEVTILRSGLKA